MREPGSDDAGRGSPAAKKRRNPWGDSSYADLITRAIETSPERRLTLSQIYDWIVRNVPHFRDQGDTSSSAGWKNSIRHNLSLYTKFKAIKNEPNRSSWWIISNSSSESRTTRRKKRSKSKAKKKQTFFGRLPTTLKTSSDKTSEISPLRNHYPITLGDLNKQNAAFLETPCHIELYKTDVRVPDEECNTADNRWFSKSLFKSPHHLSFSYVTTEIDSSLLQEGITPFDGSSETFSSHEATSSSEGMESFNSFNCSSQTISETFAEKQPDPQNGFTTGKSCSLREIIDEMMKELSEITDDENQRSSSENMDNSCVFENVLSSDLQHHGALPAVTDGFLHFNSEFVNSTTQFTDSRQKGGGKFNFNYKYSERYSVQASQYDSVHVTRGLSWNCANSGSVAKTFQRINNESVLNFKPKVTNFQSSSNGVSDFLQTCSLNGAYASKALHFSAVEPCSAFQILQPGNINTSFEVPQLQLGDKVDKTYPIQQQELTVPVDFLHQINPLNLSNQVDKNIIKTNSTQLNDTPEKNKLKTPCTNDSKSDSSIEQLSLDFANLSEIDEDVISKYLDYMRGFEDYDSDFDIYLQG